MRTETEVKSKLEEIERANKKRRQPSPERLDILSGLKTTLQLGKYGTLRDWEAKKVELKKMENEIVQDKSLFRFLRRGLYGEIIPDPKMDSIGWRMAAYSWALKIKDPIEMVMSIKLLNTAKKKRRLKEKDK